MSTDINNRVSLTLREAAASAGLSRDTLTTAIRAGRLKAKGSAVDDKGRPKTGGKTLIRPADLKAFVDGLPDL